MSKSIRCTCKRQPDDLSFITYITLHPLQCITHFNLTEILQNTPNLGRRWFVYTSYRVQFFDKCTTSSISSAAARPNRLFFIRATINQHDNSTLLFSSCPYQQIRAHFRSILYDSAHRSTMFTGSSEVIATLERRQMIDVSPEHSGVLFVRWLTCQLNRTEMIKNVLVSVGKKN